MEVNSKILFFFLYYHNKKIKRVNEYVKKWDRFNNITTLKEIKT